MPILSISTKFFMPVLSIPTKFSIITAPVTAVIFNENDIGIMSWLFFHNQTEKSVDNPVNK